MRYISTRGGIAPISFKDAVMMGLATDGGLLLPEVLPQISAQTLESWRRLKYQDLAYEVISLFSGDIPTADLRRLLANSYATFSHPDITPVAKHGDVYILELFHGPTLAFKDVALQFLGNLFEYFLQADNSGMNIIGATSGDTGSAAIYGVRGKERIKIFILHPHKRVSPIQELQMTTVLDDNVFNLAIKGSFDDGQAIVKEIFNNLAFKEKHHLGAVNSINWARILAQIVYYIYSYFRVCDREGEGPVDFAVPTGNFGDIFAGFLAKQLLTAKRIRRLVLATNENDILSRFVNQGNYATGNVSQTCSPSMDIQLASNFERYLYYLNNSDGERTRREMESFARSGTLKFEAAVRERVKDDFAAQRVTEAEIAATIKSFYRQNNYVLDPHTAVGVTAGIAHKGDIPMICLATAHPGKFGDVVGRAIGPQALPQALASLAGMETRCEVVAAESAVIMDIIARHDKP
ncbi:MAG: threonine synthase [Deltaproteobacteria bacterium]|nr:threonine synthase [Deltaproteobacteria bacterium]